MSAVLIGTVCGAIAVPGAEMQGEGQMALPVESLLTADRPAGFSVGIGLRGLQRSFEREGVLTGNVDSLQVPVRLGFSPLTIAHLYGEVGWNESDTGDEQGDGGLLWGVGLRLNVLEYVFDRSPVIGKKRVLHVAAEAGYRAYESALEHTDLQSTEWYLVPQLVYTENRRADALWQDYQPNGYSVRTGLVFSSLEAELGGSSADGEEDFGLMLGADVRWLSGWLTRVHGILYGGGDREIGLAMEYYF